MTQVFLGLGGNIGDVKNTIKEALKKIRNLPTVTEFKVSKLYRTSPSGTTIEQSDFLNCVCSFLCDIPADSLLRKLQEIERHFGRTRAVRYGPRTLDIDILFYGNERIESSTLEVPHPRFQERLFVLVPLNDLVDKVMLPDKRVFDVKEHIRELRKMSEDVVECILKNRWYEET